VKFATLASTQLYRSTHLSLRQSNLAAQVEYTSICDREEWEPLCGALVRLVRVSCGRMTVPRRARIEGS